MSHQLRHAYLLSLNQDTVANSPKSTCYHRHPVATGLSLIWRILERVRTTSGPSTYQVGTYDHFRSQETHGMCRDAKYSDRVSAIVQQFPKWRTERLPPPRVAHSQYDKVGLTSECLNNSSAPI